MLNATHEQARLCDFGFSRRKENEDEKSLTTAVGSPSWNAPEVLLKQAGIDYFQADIFSLGVLIGEIASRKTPVPIKEPLSDSERQILAAKFAEKRDGTRNPAILEYISPKLKTLLLHCCHMDPKQRPSATRILTYLLSSETEFKPMRGEITDSSSYTRSVLASTQSMTSKNWTQGVVNSVATVMAKQGVATFASQPQQSSVLPISLSASLTSSGLIKS